MSLALPLDSLGVGSGGRGSYFQLGFFSYTLHPTPLSDIPASIIHHPAPITHLEVIIIIIIIKRRSGINPIPPTVIDRD